jgi:hypothetical protein
MLVILDFFIWKIIPSESYIFIENYYSVNFQDFYLFGCSKHHHQHLSLCFLLHVSLYVVLILCFKSLYATFIFSRK